MCRRIERAVQHRVLGIRRVVVRFFAVMLVGMLLGGAGRARAQERSEPAGTPPEAPADTTSGERADQADAGPWGPPNEEGLQCRLRTPQTTWRLGETPRFEAEVRNAGTRSWSIARTQDVCELELNGVWYRWGSRFSAPYSRFSPGDEYDGIPISLVKSWRVKRSFASLLLARGSYTIRVAFPAQDFGGPRRGTPSRMISNPVSFTIGDGPVDESAPLPLTLQLEGRVVSPDGKPVTRAEVSFWRAVDATAGEVSRKYPPPPIDPGPRRWEDRATKTTWDLVHHDYVRGDRTTMPGLSVGDYRVTAWVSLAPQWDPPRPVVGVSGLIHLDGRQPETVEVVRLDIGPSLTLDFVDTTTDEGVERAELVLVRPDGLPVTPWRFGRWSTFSRTTPFTYPRLPPGRYTLHVDAAARRYGDVNYLPDETPMTIDVPEDRDTRVTVNLNRAPLTEAEISKRWPWVVTGRVTDAQGNPMEGVTVYVNRNDMHQSEDRTDEQGRYTIRFTQSGYTYDKDRKRWSFGRTTVVVSPLEPGMAERDLYEQGEVIIAGEIPSWYARQGRDPKEILLPDQPRRIDFVMVPAVTLEGRLSDASGTPIAETYVSLEGERLPPPGHEIAGSRTDAEGRFHVDAVPTGLFCWFTTRVSAEGRWHNLKTAPFSFPTPGRYQVKLTQSQAEPASPRLEIASLTDPQGADVRQ
jgi:hypothetical protein